MRLTGVEASLVIAKRVKDWKKVKRKDLHVKSKGKTFRILR